MSERYAAETHGQFMLEHRGLTFGTPAKKYRRAITALAARNSIIIDNEGDMFEIDEPIGLQMGPGLAASRRSGIAYCFEHVYGCPDKSEWQDKWGVLARLMYRMSIPLNSMRRVRTVFEEVADACAKNAPYDPHSGPRERGRPEAVQPSSREANIVAIGMKAGVGITETTVMVNEYRGSQPGNLKSISWSAVKGYIHRHKELLKLQKRAVKKCGMVAAVKESARRAEKSAPTSSFRPSLLVFLISLILLRPGNDQRGAAGAFINVKNFARPGSGYS